MRIITALIIALYACSPAPPSPAASLNPSVERTVMLERGALDRWGKGDPEGYLSIMDPGITYFDPFTERRVDGKRSLEEYFAPFKGKIRIDRYQLINPRVQQYGDVAVLTFNLVDEVDQPKGTFRWNSTEVYRRTEQGWKIIHSHWSFVRPELKTPSN